MLTGLLILCGILEAYSQITYNSMGATYTNDLLGTEHTIKTTNVSYGTIHVENYSPNYNRNYTSSNYTYDHDFEVAENAPLSPVLQKPSVTGVTMATYDNDTDTLVDIQYLDTYVKFTSDGNYTTLWMTEYDEDGKQLKQVEMPVLSMNEDEEVMTFKLIEEEFTYNLLFWKDGSMVAYQFSDEYVLLVGAIDY